MLLNVMFTVISYHNYFKYMNINCVGTLQGFFRMAYWMCLLTLQNAEGCRMHKLHSKQQSENIKNAQLKTVFFVLFFFCYEKNNHAPQNIYKIIIIIKKIELIIDTEV